MAAIGCRQLWLAGKIADDRVVGDDGGCFESLGVFDGWASGDVWVCWSTGYGAESPIAAQDLFERGASIYALHT